jgi:hypothetical protein
MTAGLCASLDSLRRTLGPLDEAISPRRRWIDGYIAGIPPDPEYEARLFTSGSPWAVR